MSTKQSKSRLISSRKRKQGNGGMSTNQRKIIYSICALSLGSAYNMFVYNSYLTSMYDNMYGMYTGWTAPIPVYEYPYEGWQPAIDPDEDCQSWLACFEENHNCTSKCRDSLLDYGSPPYRPGFTPDPDLNETENSRNAQDIPWVPDVTVLHRMFQNGVDRNGNSWPPPLVTDEDRELCDAIGDAESDENKKAIDAVPVRALPLMANTMIEWTEKKMKRAPKIMCFVYTMENKHHTYIRAIRETWGPGCDGFLAFSTRDDPRIPAISIPHQGAEEYNNMWQKVRSILRFVGTHYLEDFDFFHQGGEDMYILPQNLRMFLADQISDPITEDYYGGRRFIVPRIRQNIVYNTGGPGYTLSQATLRKLVTTGLDHPKCFPNRRGSDEDVNIARCLRNMFNITTVDTRDDQERERFHHFPPGWLYNYKPKKKGWYAKYNEPWPPKLAENSSAPDSAAFHRLRRPATVRHMHSLLYFCDERQ